MEDRPLAVIDIDGVVADVRHRLHHIEGRRKDWDAFFAAAVDDPPHLEGVNLVGKLAADHDVLFLTGRPERLRADTEAWLERHGLGGHRLVMRADGDRGPAALVKLRRLRDEARTRTVGVVVDDDPVVVDAMKEAGYLVLHADWEQRSAEDDDTLATAQEVEGET
ncbi:MAG TPA: hypothetical protein VIL36_07620 [Acidimicrobiales bacterium]